MSDRPTGANPPPGVDGDGTRLDGRAVGAPRDAGADTSETDGGRALRALFAQGRASAPRHFERTSVWIFDLDNTLYPASCNLFAQVDHRMGEFIQRLLGVPYPQARHLQKTYYRQFGTTLSGLMKVHKLDPKDFLEYVHDIDLSVVSPDPALGASIDRLPGRKLIFTNGSRRHAENVAGKLGILDRFEDICDIAACDYVPKPATEAFERMIRRHDVRAEDAAMFEDMPHNLEAPHVLGMTTVLVHSDYLDHPVQIEMRRWSEAPDHIHHLTDDLRAFLDTIRLDDKAV